MIALNKTTSLYPLSSFLLRSLKSLAPVFSPKQTLRSSDSPNSQYRFKLSIGFEMRKWRRVANEAMQFSVTAAKFIGLLHLTDSYLFSSTLVHGTSMLPTFNFSGDVVLTERLSHRFGRVVPGDVVMLRAPYDPKKVVSKRVLGMEGDKVTFVDPASTLQYQKTTVVPKGHVWIQGDNTYDSFDSRSYGPVPYGLIQGRAFFRVWPPHGFGFVDD